MSKHALSKRERYAAIEEQMTKRIEHLRDAIPRVVALTPERQIRIAMAALKGDDKLFQCSPLSILGCVFEASQLGLEIGSSITGHCWMIPRYNSKEKRYEATFQLGIQGLIELVCRTGRVTWVKACSVREKDHLEYEEGLHPVLRHVPNTKEHRGNITHCYAVACFSNGQHVATEPMEWNRIKEHLKLYSNVPERQWITHLEAFAHIVMLRKLCKRLPKLPMLDQVLDGEGNTPALPKVVAAAVVEVPGVEEHEQLPQHATHIVDDDEPYEPPPAAEPPPMSDEEIPF